MAFCGWFLLISMFPRFILVVTCISAPFLFIAGQYSVVYIDHILLIPSSVVDIWVVSTLGLLWIVLLWTFMYKSLFAHLFSVLLGVCLGVELLSDMVILCLTYWGAAKLFPTAAAWYIPTSSVRGIQFLHVLANTCYCLSFILQPS